MKSNIATKVNWEHRWAAERRMAPNRKLKYPNLRLDYWRYAAFMGQQINTYFDHDLIHFVFTNVIARYIARRNFEPKIADFGAGVGQVSCEVAGWLGQRYNRSVTAYGIEQDTDALEKMKEVAPDTVQINRSLLNLGGVREASFDAGIMRFALPFIEKKYQPKAFEEIARVMKKGSVLIVMNDGVMTENENPDYWDTLFAQGAAAHRDCSVKEIRKERHFPSCERVVEMAVDAGFKLVQATDLTDIVVGYYSPTVIGNSFDVKPDRLAELTQQFREWKDNRVLPFEPKRGSLRLPWTMYSCVLEKR